MFVQRWNSCRFTLKIFWIASAVSGFISLSTALPAVAEPPVQLDSTLFALETFTDNVDLTESDRHYDLISSTGYEFDLKVDTARNQLVAEGQLAYNSFARHSDLNDVTLNADATGETEILKNFLFIEGNATVAERFTNLTLVPATFRPTDTNSTRITTYDIGPIIRTRISNLYDVELRAKYGEIGFEDVSGTPQPTNLLDSSLVQGIAYIKNSNPGARLDSSFYGEYLKQNQGFELLNGVGRLGFRLFKGLTAIGSAGYESIKDPGVTNLDGFIWTGGLSMEPGSRSYISLEYGSRYGKPVWVGEATVLFSPKLEMRASYQQSLETAQTRLRRTLDQLNRDTPTFELGIPILPDLIDTTLVAGTFLSEDTSVELKWWLKRPKGKGPLRPDDPEPREGNRLELKYTRSHLTFFNRISEETQNIAEIRYYHEHSRRLTTLSRFEYSDISEVLTGFDGGNRYLLDFSAEYRLSDPVYASFEYAYQKTSTDLGIQVNENVLSFGINFEF